MFSSVDGFRFVNGGSGIGTFNLSGGNVIGFASAISSNGNSIFACDSINPGISTDVVLIKTDSGGIATIQKQLESSTGGTLGPNQPRKVFLDTSENIYSVGLTNDLVTNFDAYVTKFDSSMNLLWQSGIAKSLVSNTDVSYSGAVDSAGNVYVGGYTNRLGSTTNATGFLVKFDSTGNILSSLRCGPANSSLYSVTDVQVDSSDNYYTVSQTGNITLSNVVYPYGFDLGKFDSTGNLLWGKTLINPTLSTISQGIAVDGGGNVFVHSDNGANTYIYKLDSSGTNLWSKELKITYSGSNHQALVSGLVADSSNLYLNIQGAGGLGPNFIKIDSTGNSVWQQQITSNIGTISFFNASYFTPLSYSNGVCACSGTLQYTGNSVQDGLLYNFPTNGTIAATYGNFTITNSSNIIVASSGITLASGGPSFTSDTFDTFNPNIFTTTSSITQTFTTT